MLAAWHCFMELQPAALFEEINWSTGWNFLGRRILPRWLFRVLFSQSIFNLCRSIMFIKNIVFNNAMF